GGEGGSDPARSQELAQALGDPLLLVDPGDLGTTAGGGILDELAHVRLQRLDLRRRDEGAEDEVAFAAVLVALLAGQQVVHGSNTRTHSRRPLLTERTAAVSPYRSVPEAWV